MLHYWHLILARALRESLEMALPSSIAITLGSAVLTAFLVLFLRGKDKFKEHLKGSIGIAFGGALLTWLLIIFPWQFMRAPQLVQSDAVESARTSQLEADQSAIKALQAENSQLKAVIDAIKEPEAPDSLRRRTFKLADEFTTYFASVQTDKNKPPDAFPNSADPNPSDERRKAIQATQAYYQGVENYYAKHFRDRFVGIVKEYDSKGVRTGWLVNDFAQRMPAIPPAGSVMDGMDEISQFRDLAYHVDARDHLITF